ncbi:MAG: ABC transporter ATP-binding protein [Thermogemmatispora sp.]|uniref:ABC transporter ATP-binding protein n=1 Tax=Thermogemmatispora sp. TaxID=1968838 RepID=UPI0019EBBE33|nr:ABC transporter ATP-binding protein [Thermogemmatispora sp.]MBE3566385.1 ABC transporter ATP-binding protein [Thermogemmatispora sp.]
MTDEQETRSRAETRTTPAATAGSEAGPLVEVRNLVKRFGKLEAVKGVSFSIKAGEICGLLGPNGAGKSTIINILCGYLPPDEGEVLVCGYSIRRETQAVKRLLGVVPQEIALYRDLNALENLDFFASLYGVPAHEHQARAEEVLQFVGLYERRKEPLKNFSGGMLRRLNFAVALMHRPRVLLLDEPTVGVDPQSREHIFENIEKLAASGTTVLYTTHYMEEAERLCRRIAIMDEGRIIALGTLEQLLAMRDQRRAVYRPHGLQELFIQLTGKTLRDL